MDRLLRRALCVLAVLALTLSAAWAAEKTDTDPKHKLPRPDGKPADMSKPVQVFILIQCLRKDYGAPNAKFVLATIAFGGWKLAGPGLTIANAQLAVGDPKKHPEFAGSVKCIEARDFWREADVSPNPRQGHHYNRNAETYMEVGLALGCAMADLLKKEE